MEDRQIIDLYWARDEDAVRQTDIKYGRYLKKVARNIINDREYSREIVSDTYVRTWSSIPPERPDKFLIWLSRITRAIAADRLRFLKRKKRSTGQSDLPLDELEECIGDDSSRREYELSVLKDILDSFLRSYPERSRNLFLCRYFYCDSLKEAAGICGFTESAAKTQLFRMRAALRERLGQEGYTV
ncbi:MAG: sigma-70 family RNA polymerase sigma factor [Solobacterium sp.]|nr:sigma-70 family RNA polymerase sigma factor [Solobacterium sp.]